MIIVGTAGKVLSTTGFQNPDMEELSQELRKINARTRNVHLENYSIKVNEDHLLGLEMDDIFYPLSMNALKTLCGLLKVPASYLNKLISNDLTVKNINENPLKMGAELQAVLWTDDEDDENTFIAGFLSTMYISSLDLLGTIQASGIMERNNLQFHHGIVMPEMTVINLLQKQVNEVNENNHNYTYQLGISIYYSEASDKNLTIVPFYHIRYRMPNSEWMEWDFETKRNLASASRKLTTFGGEVSKILTEFDIGKLSMDFLNMRTLIESAGAIGEVRYKVFKSVFSAAKSIFTHYTLPETGQYVLADIVPEYKHFKDDNKNNIKELEPYQVANLPVPVSLPIIFNRVYYSGLLLDNPHFMQRSRSGLFKMMMIAAEEANIVM